MSELEGVYFADTMIQLEGLIVGLIITIITVVICVICTIITCLVRCSLLQTGYEFCPRVVPSRQHHRGIENQPEQDDEESGETRTYDLSQAPPPAYRNIYQYQNVDLEHITVVKSTATYRIPSNSEPETTSLPPDYTSQRISISVASQEIQVPEGQLPPTYSTAQLELMARRTAMEQDTIREWASLPEDNTETQQSEFHLPSDSQTNDVSNA